MNDLLGGGKKGLPLKNQHGGEDAAMTEEEQMMQMLEQMNAASKSQQGKSETKKEGEMFQNNHRMKAKMRFGEAEDDATFVSKWNEEVEKWNALIESEMAKKKE